ncbi:MAG: hypothetical protein RLT05_35435, partial [Bauldia litoralis]
MINKYTTSFTLFALFAFAAHAQSDDPSLVKYCEKIKNNKEHEHYVYCGGVRKGFRLGKAATARETFAPGSYVTIDGYSNNAPTGQRPSIYVAPGAIGTAGMEADPFIIEFGEFGAQIQGDPEPFTLNSYQTFSAKDWFSLNKGKYDETKFNKLIDAAKEYSAT